MAELSVIIPFVNEYPQILFTVQSIFCELRDEVDFEIICIDNWCAEVESQQRKEDKGGAKISGLAEGNHRPWLKYLKYDKKLSHWQAKNFGVENSTGEFLWFCDAHCIVSPGSLKSMFRYYKEHHEEMNGSIHLPLSYMGERPGLELIYKLVLEEEHGVYHYSFTGYNKNVPPGNNGTPFRMPCMSTCGMMITRKLYDLLGGWPKELGIYGGGEHFINFTLAVLGKTVNIFPTLPLFHYAESRGYHWNYNDYHRNRCIATFIFGGDELARLYMKFVKGRPLVLDGIYFDVIRKEREHRDLIVSRQVMTIQEWAEQWKHS